MFASLFDHVSLIYVPFVFTVESLLTHFCITCVSLLDRVSVCVRVLNDVVRVRLLCLVALCVFKSARLYM